MRGSEPRPVRERPSLANIREFEYSKNMQDTLRAYNASVFQALAHPTRIAIVEVLPTGELSTRAIHERLRIQQANLSPHQAILRTRRSVLHRKARPHAFYSLRHPVLTELLHLR